MTFDDMSFDDMSFDEPHVADIAARAMVASLRAQEVQGENHTEAGSTRPALSVRGNR